MTKYFDVVELPQARDAGLFERVCLPGEQKKRLRAEVALALRGLAVDRDRTAYQRFVLFSGPPGTGKSTTVRGLADEAARSLQGKVVLATANAGAWADGELGGTAKRVEEAFGHLRTLLRNVDFGVVQFDEVESLALSRGISMGKPEPTDVLRGVNALLNGLDRLADEAGGRFLAVGTTNVVGVLDRALHDRCDAIYEFQPLTGAAAREVLEDAVAAWVESDGFRAAADVGDAAAVASEANRAFLAGKRRSYVSGRDVRKAPRMALVRGDLRNIGAEGLREALKRTLAQKEFLARVDQGKEGR